MALKEDEEPPITYLDFFRRDAFLNRAFFFGWFNAAVSIWAVLHHTTPGDEDEALVPNTALTEDEPGDLRDAATNVVDPEGPEGVSNIDISLDDDDLEDAVAEAEGLKDLHPQLPQDQPLISLDDDSYQRALLWIDNNFNKKQQVNMEEVSVEQQDKAQVTEQDFEDDDDSPDQIGITADQEAINLSCLNEWQSYAFERIFLMTSTLHHSHLILGSPLPPRTT